MSAFAHYRQSLAVAVFHKATIKRQFRAAETTASASNWWAEIFAGMSSWAIGRPDLVSGIVVVYSESSPTVTPDTPSCRELAECLSQFKRCDVGVPTGWFPRLEDDGLDDRAVIVPHHHFLFTRPVV
jgi:hypothetical protein